LPLQRRLLSLRRTGVRAFTVTPPFLAGGSPHTNCCVSLDGRAVAPLAYRVLGPPFMIPLWTQCRTWRRRASKSAGLLWRTRRVLFYPQPFYTYFFCIPGTYLLFEHAGFLPIGLHYLLHGRRPHAPTPSTYMVETAWQASWQAERGTLDRCTHTLPSQAGMGSPHLPLPGHLAGTGLDPHRTSRLLAATPFTHLPYICPHLHSAFLHTFLCCYPSPIYLFHGTFPWVLFAPSLHTVHSILLRHLPCQTHPTCAIPHPPPPHCHPTQHSTTYLTPCLQTHTDPGIQPVSEANGWFFPYHIPLTHTSTHTFTPLAFHCLPASAASCSCPLLWPLLLPDLTSFLFSCSHSLETYTTGSFFYFSTTPSPHVVYYEPGVLFGILCLPLLFSGILSCYPLSTHTTITPPVRRLCHSPFAWAEDGRGGWEEGRRVGT